MSDARPVKLIGISALFNQTSEKDTSGITYTFKANEKAMDGYSWEMRRNDKIISSGTDVTFSIRVKKLIHG